MGHKRKKMRYEDSEQIVTISIEHPENNPQGVTVEEVEEEMQKQPFGINVGQQVEDLLKASNETAKQQVQEEQTMKEETKETTVNENINSNKQEESKMKEEEAKETTTNENRTTPEQDIPDPNRKIEPDKPGSIIDREAVSHAVRGICYGAGVVVGMTVTSCLIYGIQKLIAGDSNEQTTETLSKLI
nr:MAG TPA: hypothetical protein [Bacteriophage sp.]